MKGNLFYTLSRPRLAQILLLTTQLKSHFQLERNLNPNLTLTKLRLDLETSILH